MGTKNDIKQLSRVNYSVSLSEGQLMSNELITMGAIQRIADATELMASNYKKLQDDVKMYERWYNEETERNNRLRKSISVLKGHITRLKKRVESILPVQNPPKTEYKN